MLTTEHLREKSLSSKVKQTLYVQMTINLDGQIWSRTQSSIYGETSAIIVNR